VAGSSRPAFKSLNIEFRNKPSEAADGEKSSHFLGCYPSPDRAADRNEWTPKMMCFFYFWKTGRNAPSAFSRKAERRRFSGECHAVVSWSSRLSWKARILLFESLLQGIFLVPLIYVLIASKAPELRWRRFKKTSPTWS
jgi:hypothetical protein